MTRKPTDIAPLDRLGWLAGQPETLRDWIASVGVWRDYAPGQIVYLADDPADGLYGLARGTLDISSPGAGDEQVALSRAEPGFWIGDAALLVEHGPAGHRHRDDAPHGFFSCRAPPCCGS